MVSIKGAALVVFQANTGSLVLKRFAGLETVTDTQLGMMPGTSPSVTTLKDKSFVIAFRANTGNLWVTRGNPPVGIDTQLGMMESTSPSIAMLPGGGYVVAFQANTGVLGINSNGTRSNWADTNLGMMPGTSPCVGEILGLKNTHSVAFQANTASLWLSPAYVQISHDTQLAMAPGTGPAMTRADFRLVEDSGE